MQKLRESDSTIALAARIDAHLAVELQRMAEARGITVNALAADI